MSEYIPTPADIVVSTDDLEDIDRILKLSESQPVFISKDGHVSGVLLGIDLYDRIENILFDLELQERCRRANTDNNSTDAVESIQRLLEENKREKPVRILDPKHYWDILSDFELREIYLRSETDGRNVNAKEFLEKLMDERRTDRTVPSPPP